MYIKNLYLFEVEEILILMKLKSLTVPLFRKHYKKY